ncbi:MAG: hypothetical protein GKS00_04530 [Alphaproteobacteria bacterium]|nr:hypothetical protein [Alphaproteobacteria bacterium]
MRKQPGHREGINEANNGSSNEKDSKKLVAKRHSASLHEDTANYEVGS